MSNTNSEYIPNTNSENTNSENMSNTNSEYIPLNALVYAYIQNNIPTSLSEFTSLMNVIDSNASQNDSPAEQNQILNNILDKTTIKRACCLAKQYGPANWANSVENGKYLGIEVKIPTPENHVYDTTSEAQLIQQQFGYIDKLVYVPVEMCEEAGITVNERDDTTFGTCNQFYKTYCENQKYFYNLENNGQYDSDQFLIYTNYECPCFTKMPAEYAGNQQAESGPAVCYKPYCSLNGGANIYFDQKSRNVKNTCSANMCENNLTIVSPEISGNAKLDLSNKTVLKCGVQEPTSQNETNQEQTSKTSGRKLSQKIINRYGAKTHNGSGHLDNQNTDKIINQNSSIGGGTSGGIGGGTSGGIGGGTSGGIGGGTGGGTSGGTGGGTSGGTGGGNNQQQLQTPTKSHKDLYIIIGISVGVIIIIGIIFAIIMTRKN